MGGVGQIASLISHPLIAQMPALAQRRAGESGGGRRGKAPSAAALTRAGLEGWRTHSLRGKKKGGRGETCFILSKQIISS